ncbi:MAG: efflux RND transporter periplasmic adaptor subunit [Proteobacteria bacterium]|nr:efflux RND transporter periplasmic adaptor subunit [Pseudomonadota bacterium]
MKREKPFGRWGSVVGIRIAVCLLVLAIGIVGMKTLADMKKPPAEKKVKEPVLKVETVRAELEDVPVTIGGYGEVTALNVVSISPEVAGRVAYIHPRLEVGEIVREGDVLFEIDSRDYDLAYRTGIKRLKTLGRSRDLARIEYERLRRLFKDKNIGSLVEVENAELSYNTMVDQVDRVEFEVKSAEINLKRSTVRAPFSGRVKTASVEKEQYVAPGVPLLTLANDAVLEIRVSIDSTKARQVLRFKPNTRPKAGWWFADLEKIPCRIIWSQGNDEIHLEGTLHRIVEFEPQTRTLKVAVRLNAAQGNEKRAVFPIVEGMFCQVIIPGRTLFDVVRLPRRAVGFDNTVHIVSENRLKTVPVTLGNVDDDYALVTSGLKKGERVIVTRLTSPMENALLETSDYELSHYTKNISE